MTAVDLNPTVKWFAELGLADLDQVGGKNASLGEMVRNLATAGVTVPGRLCHHGGCLPAFLGQTGLDQMINAALDRSGHRDVERARRGRQAESGRRHGRQPLPGRSGSRHPYRLRAAGR